MVPPPHVPLRAARAAWIRGYADITCNNLKQWLIGFWPRLIAMEAQLSKVIAMRLITRTQNFVMKSNKVILGLTLDKAWWVSKLLKTWKEENVYHSHTECFKTLKHAVCLSSADIVHPQVHTKYTHNANRQGKGVVRIMRYNQAKAWL